MGSALTQSEKEAVREWARGKSPGHYRWTCPACSSQRRNRTAQCLSVSVESDKVLFQCWHCEASGAVRLAEQTPKPVYSKPVFSKAVKGVGDALSMEALAFLEGRKISEKTAKVYGVVGALAFFPDLKAETKAIAFPYTKKLKSLGYKLRSVESKAHVCSTALKTLFGLDMVDAEETKHLVICEGELDSLSFYEADVLNAVSVPNGAQSFGRGDEREAQGFLWDAKEVIEKVEKIYIATDADDPGERLGEEIARRIGKYRCWKVAYPEGCKDANDVLMKFGKAELAACFKNAEPWPVSGLYEASHYFDDVSELYRDGFGDRVKTGLSGVDGLYSVGDGLLTVVTGIPGNGKSTFVDQLMVNLSRMYGHVNAICSFENPPKVHIGKLAEMLLQKHFFETDKPGKRMSEHELRLTYPFINQHFKFLQQDDGAKASVDSIIERVKTAVFRWGIRNAVIDPYNYIERPKSAESETQFIDDLLTRLRLLANAHGIHIWFVAHPTKMTMHDEGNYDPPRGYSISGSAAWYAKADFGLTVHKSHDMPGEVRIINWKTRFTWLGEEGDTTLLFDNTRHIYVSDPTTDLTPWSPSFEDDYE